MHFSIFNFSLLVLSACFLNVVLAKVGAVSEGVDGNMLSRQSSTSANLCGGLGQIESWSFGDCSSSTLPQCVIALNTSYTGSLRFRPGLNHSKLMLDIRVKETIKEFQLHETTSMVGTSFNTSVVSTVYFEFPSGVYFPNTPEPVVFELKLTDDNTTEVCMEFTVISPNTTGHNPQWSYETEALDPNANCNNGSYRDPCLTEYTCCSFNNSVCLPVETESPIGTEFRCLCDPAAVLESGGCKKTLGTRCEDEVECVQGLQCASQPSSPSYKFCFCKGDELNPESRTCSGVIISLSLIGLVLQQFLYFLCTRVLS